MWNSKIDNFVHVEANIKTCFQVGVTTTNDATFSFRNVDYEELPDWPFQILPTQVQKCQKRFSFSTSRLALESYGISTIE